jgi:hypothetical protein
MISPLLSSITAVATELLLACLPLQFFAKFGFFSGYFPQHVVWICLFLLQWLQISLLLGFSLFGLPPPLGFFPPSWYLLLPMQFHPCHWSPCLPLTFLMQGNIVSASHPAVSQW